MTRSSKCFVSFLLRRICELSAVASITDRDKNWRLPAVATQWVFLRSVCHARFVTSLGWCALTMPRHTTPGDAHSAAFGRLIRYARAVIGQWTFLSVGFMHCVMCRALCIDAHPARLAFSGRGGFLRAGTVRYCLYRFYNGGLSHERP